MDVRVVEAPAEAGHDPLELRPVLLERGEDSRLAVRRALEQEMQADQRLAHAGRSRDQRRGARPQAVAEHVVQRLDTDVDAPWSERVRRLVLDIGETREARLLLPWTG